MAKSLDEMVEDFRHRPLEGAYPFVWLDALVLAVGVNEDRKREILGVDVVTTESRSLYAWTQVTLDVVFPVVYGLLFLLAIASLYDRKPALWLMGVPLLAVASDLLENGLLAYLAFTFEEAASPLGRIASLCTSTKFVLLSLSLVALLPGLIARLRSKHEP